MSSRSKWEDMTNYAHDLGVSISGKGEFSEKRNKAIDEYRAQKAAESKPTPKEDTSDGRDISIGATVEQIKKRNKMMSDL